MNSPRRSSPGSRSASPPHRGLALPSPVPGRGTRAPQPHRAAGGASPALSPCCLERGWLSFGEGTVSAHILSSLFNPCNLRNWAGATSRPRLCLVTVAGPEDGEAPAQGHSMGGFASSAPSGCSGTELGQLCCTGWPCQGPGTRLSLGRTLPAGTVGWNSRQGRARQGQGDTTLQGHTGSSASKA